VFVTEFRKYFALKLYVSTIWQLGYVWISLSDWSILARPFLITPLTVWCRLFVGIEHKSLNESLLVRVAHFILHILQVYLVCCVFWNTVLNGLKAIYTHKCILLVLSVCSFILRHCFGWCEGYFGDFTYVSYNVKGYGLGTCCNIAYMTQPCDQKCFAVSEVAPDWAYGNAVFYVAIHSCANRQLDLHAAHQLATLCLQSTVYKLLSCWVRKMSWPDLPVG